MNDHLEYIINHVFLPPQLPQKDDSSPINDVFLAQNVLQALKVYRENLPNVERSEWLSCIGMVESMLVLQDSSGSLNAEKLQWKLSNMKDGDVLALHIRSQNAGLIVRRSSNQVSFESFELSPTNVAVTGTRGRLRRHFPGPALAVSLDHTLDSDFRNALVDFLVKLDAKTPEDVQPTVIKAGSKVIETRDTVHPRYITDMLTGFLRAVGHPLELPRIVKCTREEVLWDSTYQPWRRSPYWLLIRVALQTTLAVNGAGNGAHMKYKFFMIFFMAGILQKGQRQSFSSDVLFTMTAKVCRRALKLGVTEERLWLRYAERIIKAVHVVLSERWRSLEQSPDPFATQQAWTPSRLCFLQDTELTLSTMRPYLRTRNVRHLLQSPHQGFVSSLSPRISQGSEKMPDLRPRSDSNNDGARLLLADLELWVSQSLQGWLSTQANHNDTCAALKDLIDNYTATASRTYSDAPEEISLMFLTVMELWVALDECALRAEPILQDYDPGFPSSLFEPLLLPKRHQMERLLFVEQYLMERKRTAKPLPSVFRSVNSADSLPVRFFDQSSIHQELRQRIEAKANDTRSAKKRQLEKLQKEYNQLVEEAHKLEHTDVIKWTRRRQFSTHKPNMCRKCQLGNQANAMTIDIHEWPLPERDLEARSAVFELDVPTSISEWRDVTYSILVDTFATAPEPKTSSTQRNFYWLYKHDGLRHYIRSEPGRIQLASTEKSFNDSHYRPQKISHATEAGICLNHGLRYNACDSKRKERTQDFVNLASVRRRCTLNLPLGPLANLQYALDNTTHTSNEVIATQTESPVSLTLHEYYAFTTLRSGLRLLWRNIARELTARVLNFSRHETYSLITQATWQVGPLGGGSHVFRESHVDLEEEEFGMSLVLSLKKSLETVESNWQGASAVRTFVALAARILSLSPHESVREAGLQFLRKARTTALLWTRELSHKLQEEPSEEDVELLRIQVLEMALTCHESFDVEPHQLAALLTTSEDIADITECSIAIHDHCPPDEDGLSPVVKALLRRHWRRAHVLEPFLRKQIALLSAGLDNTVQRLWTRYQPCNLWTSLGKPYERWIVTQTWSDDTSAISVHYNLLDGSLLVNGSSLARLPKSYESDPSYRRVFGEKVLDVIPSTKKGMVYETRDKVFDHQVFFAMHQSKLIIQARKDRRTHEMVPIDIICFDFPAAFSQDYVHWLDIETSIIEWRPLTSPWSASTSGWQMRPNINKSLSLIRESLRLLDIQSPTTKAICSTFSPLEQAAHIQVLLHDETGLLKVRLPRLKLDFFLRKGTLLLESKQFRGMVVDSNQSLGAFTGLANKLVLRGKNSLSRSVIVPYGDVTFSRENQHVRVNVKSTAEPSYHIFSVDQVLGRLVDNGSLMSKFYKCYLHAITSHCLPDTLTSRTGTEEALSILRSASAQSFLRLEEEEISLLERIAKLTPHRRYYPQHLKVMHTVQWTTLPSLSQHHAFSGLVHLILQAKKFQLFQENPIKIPEGVYYGEQSLLDRAAIRNSAYCVHGFGAEDYSTSYDLTYTARDAVSDKGKELYICQIAKLVDEWSQRLRCSKDLLSKIMSWGAPIRGNQAKTPATLGFDFEWLTSASQLLPGRWCTLQAQLSKSTKSEKYAIMMFLSTLGYSQYRDPELIETLLALATIPRLHLLKPPSYDVYNLSEGFRPEKQKLVGITQHSVQPFSSCPEFQMPSLPNETDADSNDRRREEHGAAQDEHVNSFADELVTQWPAAILHTPSSTVFSTYIRVEEALKAARTQFNIWHRNVEFQQYTTFIQSILNDLVAGPRYQQPYSFSRGAYEPLLTQRHVDFDFLLTRSAPSIPLAKPENFDSWVIKNGENAEDHGKLQALLARLSLGSPTGFEQRYVEDLCRSFDSLHSNILVSFEGPSQGLKQHLERHVKLCEMHMKEVRRIILDTLEARPLISLRLAFEARMWPRLSETSLLQYLADFQAVSLDQSWKNCFVQYGLSISQFQRANRLVESVGNESDLLSELQNVGRQGWNPMRYPDWLLLEIENNLCIRLVQARIAHEMIEPSTGGNSVMQLNMGEGKSSVIVPIVAAALANKEQLVRIVVLKPLAPQMFHSLVKKLGELLNRRVFYMPFSRAIRLNVQQVLEIRQLYEECMSTGGVLLTQPEHLLSFELMGPERLLSKAPEVGNAMVDAQRWLDTHSRDVLDESDEILSVRFELTYTMGKQRMIEFNPDRWLIVEHVLGLVRRFADEVLRQFPHGLELQSTCPGSFPRLRVLQASAGEKLMTRIAEHIRDEGIPGLPVWNRVPRVRNLLYQFLTDINMSEAEAKPLEVNTLDVESLKKTLLLLRGLIAGRILLFAFEQKRWRVNYGLDPSRTMLSVPYRAKDIPATRAEFSHPDITLVLTCLSYYYGGLSDEQLYSAFALLLQSDQAQDEYDRWVMDAPALPNAFRQLVGVNLSDQTQCCQKVFPFLYFAKGAIDFYMSRVVFPREMQEFSEKLSASGWDIAKAKTHPITGFSGTNDSQYVLPLSTSQCDHPEQLHTNAAVLDCLLGNENTFHHSVERVGKESFDAKSLLKLVVTSDPPVRVILDVGAQVLELTNEEVAHTWLLQVDPSKAQAAVFFDDRNELSVLSRDRTVEPLLISPFAKQMDQCLVYLDESHTRGTDLKLPISYRAAVTLGPGLTKDRLVQACMRMRRLGKGQSVMFCAPLEIEDRIHHCTGKSNGEIIEVADVLEWSIQETCISTKKCVPLWAIQGIRHQRRHIQWSDSLGSGDTLLINAAKQLPEPEAKSLEERYGFQQHGLEEQILLRGCLSQFFEKRQEQVDAIRAKCRDFGVVSFNSATLQEEQERELSPENEKERQVERPPREQPLKHVIHPDVKRFIHQGIVDRTSGAFRPAFRVFEKTTAVKHFEAAAWSTQLLVTRDFAQTVEASGREHLDDFLRPVQWIATRGSTDAVILSPYEANELLPAIRSHKAVTLHVYSPRVNMSVASLEGLSFCAIPPVPRTWTIPPFVTELNLFAGQLYLRSHDEYLSLCRYLGLCSRRPESGVRVHGDGFVEVTDRARQDKTMANACRFVHSPVEFLRILMALRRKGQDFKRSHMGGLLHGELLGKERFEEWKG